MDMENKGIWHPFTVEPTPEALGYGVANGCPFLVTSQVRELVLKLRNKQAVWVRVEGKVGEDPNLWTGTDL